MLVVEHDLEAIRAADYMVELGPASGENGGQVVFAGPVSDAAQSPLTGKYLTGAARIPIPDSPKAAALMARSPRRDRAQPRELSDVKFPLDAMTVGDRRARQREDDADPRCPYRALETRLTVRHRASSTWARRVGAFGTITGWETLEDVVLVDQSPIGRTPRSNPVTYVKAWDEVRRIFAASRSRERRRYTAGTFSFNVARRPLRRVRGRGAGRRSRWSSWPTCSSPATSAAASASSATCSR